MKVCSKCGIPKELDKFSRMTRSKDGRRKQCKDCVKKDQADYYIRNKGEINQRNLEYYQSNKEDRKDYYSQYYIDNIENKKSYREENSERQSEYMKIWREENKDKIKEWYCENTDKTRFYNSKRRAKILQAIPKWADLEKIKAIYEDCRRITKETGIDHQVDHIIPLCHPLVSGLHVENNLQIIPKIDNLKKSNKFDINQNCAFQR